MIVFGELSAGSETTPHEFDAKIVLTGRSTDPDIVLGDWAPASHAHHGDGHHHAHSTTPIDNKALIVADGAKISLHGSEMTSWTQLGSTAAAGDTSITLVEDPTGWSVGDVITVAPTGFEAFEVEERIVTRIEGNTVFFDQPLEFQHYGERQYLGDGEYLDMRAEVANLSRNISVIGADEGEGTPLGIGENPQDVPRQGYGGHTMYLTGAEVKIDGVEFQGLGISGELGRYPVHFHHTGDMTGSYVKDSSIHHSFQRGLVVHQADNGLFEGNVVYDTVSHNIYLEDGVETGNRFVDNLAMLPRDAIEELRIDNPNNTSRGEERSSSFWITNAENEFVGNHAVAVPDGQGFWFVNPDNASGTASFASAKTAKERDDVLLRFEDNTAHTIGSKGGNLGYRFDWTGNALDLTDVNADPNHAVIKNFTAWKVENHAIHVPPNRDFEFEGTTLADARVFIHSSKRGFRERDEPLTFTDTNIVVQSDNTTPGQNISEAFGKKFPGPFLVEAVRPIELEGGKLFGEDELRTNQRKEFRDRVDSSLQSDPEVGPAPDPQPTPMPDPQPDPMVPTEPSNPGTDAPGPNVITGTAGDDSLLGLAESDHLQGLDGDDFLAAGAGDDTLNGDGGDDELWGEDGDDLLTGGGGRDMLAGGDGTDTLNGDDGDDQLWAEDGDDLLNGGAGQDLLVGAAGADTLNGDDGNDALWAEDGDDLLNGGLGEDLLVGADGNDTLDGGDESDALWGQTGDDLLFGGEGIDLLAGGEGRDTLNGDGGDDQLWAEDGDDLLNGGDGVDLLAGGNGADTLNGDGGDDQLWAESGNDSLNGGQGNDLLVGGDGDDTLNGNEDDDQLWAEAGNDSLDGGLGDDLLVGGDGADTLVGGVGQDILFGQNGSDVFVIVDGTIHDVVADFTIGEDQIDLRAFQTIQSFDDLLTRASDIGGATLFSLDGDDFLTVNGVSVSDLSETDFLIG